MSDYSLMNPNHLKQEMHDLETELIPSSEQFAEEVHADIERVQNYFRNQYDEPKNENIVLTREQAEDVLRTIAKIDMYRWRYSNGYKFKLRVYKNLLTDRRWVIGSKLKWLNQK